MTAKPCNRRLVILAALSAALAVSCLHPPYPREMFMQHSATLVALGILFLSAKKDWLTTRSFTLAAVFLLLHIIGARWIYSYVPYNEWSKALLHFDLNAALGFRRNHYDRLVHFMYGALLLFPVSEILHKKSGLTFRQSLPAAWCVLMAGSMVYEVFEWGLTLVLSPDAADSYNGQQGDAWDAQKDMALAMLGALVSAIFSALAHRFRWFSRPAKNSFQ